MSAGKGTAYSRADLACRSSHGMTGSRALPGVNWEAIVRVACVLFFSAAVFGQSMAGGIMAPPANVRPPGLKNVGIEQRLNEQIPPNLVFRDETGKQVRLSDYFGKKPMILNLMYYRCPMLCSEVLVGLSGALRTMKFDVGKEFDVLTVSFDPKDTPEIDRLTQAVGFRYRRDPKTGQYIHSTALIIVTPHGKIAQYYYGV